jgi:LysR family glycine cleavage system transcriptional activator
VRRRLPPLTALRAFEAAARRLSLARAAEELYVTPAAVSHQIKSLEEWLGVRLFQRHNGMLRLTPTGQAYFSGVAEGLDRLWQVTEQLSVRDARTTLSVVVPPSIASKWLIPRLHRYHERHPDIDVRFTVLTPPIDFSQHMMDVGVGFGWEVAADLERWPWLSYNIIAVASPRLLEGRPPLSSLENLAHYPLIHDDALKIHDRIDWKSFLDTFGMTNMDTNRGPRFSHATHAYQTAIEGHGIVLAKSALVSLDIVEGRLVKVFDLQVPSEYTYQIICSEALMNAPKVVDFRRWLEEEAERDGTRATTINPVRRIAG